MTDIITQVAQWIIAVAGIWVLVLSLIRIGQWSHRVNVGIADIEEIKVALVSLREARYGALQGASPRTLTKVGKDIFEKAQLDDLVKVFADELKRQSIELEPYDIQDLCFSHPREKVALDSKLKNRLRSIAYEHGIDHWTLMDILAVKVRDKLLEAKKKQSG